MNNGKPNVAELLGTAASRSIAANPIQNLQELLNAIREAPPRLSGQAAMLRTVGSRLSEFLEKPLEQISIDELIPIGPRFKAYLKERRYDSDTVRAYCYHLRKVVKIAPNFGWVRQWADVAKEWEKIRQAVWNPKNSAVQIVEYAISIGKPPAQLTEKELKEWCDLTAAQGRRVRYARDLAATFRNRIFRAGLQALLPNLSPPRRLAYGVPLKEWPKQIRMQVEKLIKWKTDEVSPDRAKRGRHRLISALIFERFVCRLYGFVSKIQRRQPSNLRSLFSKASLFSFVNWCREERQVRKVSLFNPLGMVYSIVKTYPYFKGGDFEWPGNLVAQLEDNEEDEYLASEARKLKLVDYDSLEELPQKIRQDAAKACTKPSKKYAAAMRDALLIEWLVTLPWRQRNLREMRIGRQEDGANIYKAPLDDDRISRPGWLVEELRGNPHLEVRQFRFRPREIKTNHFVRGILPKQIAVPLEEYVSSFRPLLITGNDPGTVFLNDFGGPYSMISIYNRVTEITFRYLGRPVYPHLFRHIFATKFLEEQPENYLTLSKILWHREVKTTIRLYGAGYDESHGARAAEEWRDRRSARAHGPATSGYCGHCGQPVTGRFCANCGNPTGR